MDQGGFELGVLQACSGNYQVSPAYRVSGIGITRLTEYRGLAVHGGTAPEYVQRDNPLLQQKMKPRHLQMIAVGGSIGTGLFVGFILIPVVKPQADMIGRFGWCSSTRWSPRYPHRLDSHGYHVDQREYGPRSPLLAGLNWSGLPSPW
jgi:hypothetical protein